MDTRKLSAGATFPDIVWDAVGGTRIAPAQATGWRVLVVYRGKHCPLCKKYLNGLNEMLGEFESAGIAIAAVSADTQEKADAQAAECAWTFPVGYGLSIPQMRELGLYISDPRSAEETDRPFAEPGLFAINPDGNVQIIDISNAPFARPDLKSLLSGLSFVIDKNYPIRGQA